MYALSLGVQHLDEVLPDPVYALLSGLNASTVGIIALAAVQLAEKAIKDKFSRILIIFGACAGLCYTALWYFPVLMTVGGLAAVIWYGWMSQKLGKLRAKLERRRRQIPEGRAEEASAANSIPLEERATADNSGIQRRNTTSTNSVRSQSQHELEAQPSAATTQHQRAPSQSSPSHVVRVRVGIAIVIFFFGMALPYSSSGKIGTLYPA